MDKALDQTPVIGHDGLASNPSTPSTYQPFRFAMDDPMQEHMDLHYELLGEIASRSRLYTNAFKMVSRSHFHFEPALIVGGILDKIKPKQTLPDKIVKAAIETELLRHMATKLGALMEGEGKVEAFLKALGESVRDGEGFRGKVREMFGVVAHLEIQEPEVRELEAQEPEIQQHEMPESEIQEPAPVIVKQERADEDTPLSIQTHRLPDQINTTSTPARKSVALIASPATAFTPFLPAHIGSPNLDTVEWVSAFKSEAGAERSTVSIRPETSNLHLHFAPVQPPLMETSDSSIQPRMEQNAQNIDPKNSELVLHVSRSTTPKNTIPTDSPLPEHETPSMGPTGLGLSNLPGTGSSTTTPNETDPTEARAIKQPTPLTVPSEPLSTPQAERTTTPTGPIPSDARIVQQPDQSVIPTLSRTMSQTNKMTTRTAQAPIEAPTEHRPLLHKSGNGTPVSSVPTKSRPTQQSPQSIPPTKPRSMLQTDGITAPTGPRVSTGPRGGLPKLGRQSSQSSIPPVSLQKQISPHSAKSNHSHLDSRLHAAQEHGIDASNHTGQLPRNPHDKAEFFRESPELNVRGAATANPNSSKRPKTGLHELTPPTTDGEGRYVVTPEFDSREASHVFSSPQRARRPAHTLTGPASGTEANSIPLRQDEYSASQQSRKRPRDNAAGNYSNEARSPKRKSIDTEYHPRMVRQHTPERLPFPEDDHWSPEARRRRDEYDAYRGSRRDPYDAPRASRRDPYEEQPESRRSVYDRFRYEEPPGRRRSAYDRGPYDAAPDPRRPTYDASQDLQSDTYDEVPDTRRFMYDTTTDQRRATYDAPPQSRRDVYEAPPEPYERPATESRESSPEEARPHTRSGPSLFDRISRGCSENCNCKLRRSDGTYDHIRISRQVMFSQQPEPIVTLLNGSIGPLSVETGESWCGKAIEEFQSRAANMECHKLVKTISKINPKNSQTQDFDLRLGKACQLEAHTKNLTIGGRAPRTLGVESILGRFVVANRPLFPELDLCQLSDRFLEFDGRPIR